MDRSPPGFCLQNFPGKNTGVGCQFLHQGNLPDPGIDPGCFASPALAGRFFTTVPPGTNIPNMSVLSCYLYLHAYYTVGLSCLLEKIVVLLSDFVKVYKFVFRKFAFFIIVSS